MDIRVFTQKKRRVSGQGVSDHAAPDIPHFQKDCNAKYLNRIRISKHKTACFGIRARIRICCLRSVHPRSAVRGLGEGRYIPMLTLVDTCFLPAFLACSSQIPDLERTWRPKTRDSQRIGGTESRNVKNSFLTNQKRKVRFDRTSAYGLHVAP